MQLYESKWGYHAINHETFVKLKALNKRVTQSLSAIANANRWLAKKDKNRVIRRWVRNELKQRIGYEVVGRQPKPFVCPLFGKCNGNRYWLTPTAEAILSAYQDARRPKQPKDVKPLKISDKQIDALYKEVETWFSRPKNE